MNKFNFSKIIGVSFHFYNGKVFWSEHALLFLQQLRMYDLITVKIHTLVRTFVKLFITKLITTFMSFF